ncbi:MAG: hypothetical protein PHI64_11060 [Zoogloea sp.]|uniref:hypothetical protein n=1 Tax=Zoogloea sp. TaxID=49181 RepID=UPI00261D5D21|nr:hypothetical protein [Zoogloea sp.]MDD2989484.1 hypothetical protein [Zoogloea sp.]
MTAASILYLSPAGLAAFAVARDSVEPLQHFAADDGLSPFETFLSDLSPGTRISLLVDLPDEAHHLETLPFVKGRDRQPMLARRQDHLFGDTPFRSYLSLGRESVGRRDERILFAALTRPGAIQPWLQRILHSPCILAEVVSASFLSQALAAPLYSGATPFLLAHTTPAGLRVSCFEHGQLRFSRLTIGLTPEAGPDPGFVFEEIRRSYDYLLSQRIVPRDHPTRVLLLTARDLPGAAAGTGLDLQPVPLKQAALALKLQHDASHTDSLPLLLRALAAHPRLPQFAPAEALAGHRQQRTGRIAGILAGAIFLASLGYTSLNLLAAREQRSLAEANLRQAAQQEARLEAVIASTPATPLPLERLNQTLDMAQALSTSSIGPEPALRQLTAALASVPGFRLQELEWAAPAADLLPAEPTPLSQTLRIRFNLSPGAAQTRERVAQAQTLLTALGSLNGAQIQVLRQPAEMASSEPVRIAESPPSDTSPQLEVRLSLPVSPP